MLPQKVYPDRKDNKKNRNDKYVQLTPSYLCPGYIKLLFLCRSQI